ncbi:hypothetical protein RR46_14831 [Papilio xuthus]|uniref:Uncharacterized protein n=1 Tax=Papilio xuthus TaxID=66420 RepID=A0A194PDK0_PAPXU|nr:hypothetical protein RR46_14831 [Papilio xuthus]
MRVILYALAMVAACDIITGLYLPNFLASQETLQNVMNTKLGRSLSRVTVFDVNIVRGSNENILSFD